MSVAKIYSAQPHLLTASIITIEVDLSKGLHAFTIVGLAGKAVDEAKDRISAAIKNSGWKSPKAKNQKVVISLAPADIRKDGTGFDLAMALSYLVAAEEIRFDAKNKLFIGELSLDGHVEATKGVLPMIIEAKRRGFTECFVPKINATEAALVDGITIYPVETLLETIAHIDKKKYIDPQPKTELANKKGNGVHTDIDMSEVKGQFAAKRALEIALAGGHNILMYGPPGTGKTMLARAAASLLPDLSFQDMLEVTSIYSVHGGSTGSLMTEPPFRAPHHTASYVSIVGGGSSLRPGEVTLAHKGILFLDEMPEFSTQVLETLREPLEEGKVRISRARGSALYPANFMLIGAMNPCPCGNHGVKGKVCVCSALYIEKYKRKLSGPIADRIDLWVEVWIVEHEKLADGKLDGETSAEIGTRIQKARDIQKVRYIKENITLNSELSAKHINSLIQVSDECKVILNQFAKKLDLSARSYHRIIKTARTIADLAGEEEIHVSHMHEALQYRPKVY
jgi:magnesium chelatase family protein